MVVLSGGTSKGAGDLSHRVVSQLGEPGILVHGVALKPGKPLCLAVADGKPIVVLPGFPTSAIFTFHAFVAPVIRARAGLPPEAAETVEARVPLRIASEMGRKEFVLVSLVAGEDGAMAFPSAKGSGAVTSFSQADGFIEIDALAGALDADTQARVTLIGARRPRARRRHHGQPRHRARRRGRRARRARLLRAHHRGRQPGRRRGGAARRMRRRAGASGRSGDRHSTTSTCCRPGCRWSRAGSACRACCSGRATPGSRAARGRRGARPRSPIAHCLMVNRNAGAGTRVLIDKLLDGARPPGYANQPRSHNAVAAAIAQARADWGVAIEPVAKMYGLGFLPLAPEEYDFLLVESRRDRPAVQAFLAALRDPGTRQRIAALGMQPADD